MLPSSSSGSGDPGIVCFQHCASKVFCFTLPDVCPTCKVKLNEKDLKLMPFRLPYPFVRASQYPCSIVLRPTIGDFLNDYNNSKDLHIAVTTSRGLIVEFDKNGLKMHSPAGERIGKSAEMNIETIVNNNDCEGDLTSHKNGHYYPLSSWSQSLLVEKVPEPWYDLWDSVLDEVCEQPQWSVEHYNEDTYNCYTFVLTFLQALCYDKLSKAAQSKTSFCERYIVPKTTTAGKYISLYRKIRDNGIYIHPAIKRGINTGGAGSDNKNVNSIKGNSISKLCTIEE